MGESPFQASPRLSFAISRVCHGFVTVGTRLADSCDDPVSGLFPAFAR